MSIQIHVTKSNRFILATFVPALLSMSILLSAQSAKAHEVENTASKSMPAQSMDHSKMGDMKHMEGTKDMGGMKHVEGMSMTGNVDYDFAVNMRKHHQMAVDMSQAQLKNGKSPMLRTLATKIIAAQKKEIASLDAWLAGYKKAK